jgi:hypothetical protein
MLNYYNMKKTILLTCLIFGSVGTLCADVQKTLQIQSASGTTEVPVGEVVSLTFPDTQTMLLRTRDGEQTKISLSDIFSITLGEGTTSLLSLSQGELRVARLDADHYTFSGEAVHGARLIDAAGRLVQEVDGEGQVSLSLAGLPSGLYLVHVAGTITKILRP